MPAQAPTGYLRLEEVAQELNLPDRLDAARLTASGRLPSVRIPRRGDKPELSEVRVAADSLARYIAAGCNGLPGPMIGAEAGWIVDDRADRLSETFADAVCGALPAAGPSDADLQRQAATADQVEVVVSPNAAGLAALLKAAPPRSTLPDAPTTPFAKWADAFAVVMLRGEVRRAIGRAMPGRLPMESLCVSPSDFQRFTSEAYDAIRSRVISTTRNLRVGGRAGIVRDVPCRLALPFAAFMPPLPALRLMAF